MVLAAAAAAGLLAWAYLPSVYSLEENLSPCLLFPF